MKSVDLRTITSVFLLPALGFFVPISVAVGTLLSVAVMIGSFVRAETRHSLGETVKNRVVLAILVFFLLHLVGLLWTENMDWGWHMLNKQWRLLSLPCLMVFVDMGRRQSYLDAFIAGMGIVHILVYLNIFHLIDFVVLDHISYNPLLALAIYLTGCAVLFGNIAQWQKKLYWVLLFSMSVNMFLTYGRTGQLAFFVVLLLLFFQYFSGRPLIAIAVSSVAVCSVFFAMFFLSPVFQHRVKGAVDEVTHFEMNRISPDGNDRITFFLNTWELVTAHPFWGVGTGDFPAEYKKINMERSPNVFNTDNPHNNYLLVTAQFGLFGLAALIAVLCFQIRYGLKSEDRYLKYLRIGLPAIYCVIMSFDSYLVGHTTALAFVYLSAVLYKGSHEL